MIIQNRRWPRIEACGPPLVTFILVANAYNLWLVLQVNTQNFQHANLQLPLPQFSWSVWDMLECFRKFGVESQYIILRVSFHQKRHTMQKTRACLSALTFFCQESMLIFTHMIGKELAEGLVQRLYCQYRVKTLYGSCPPGSCLLFHILVKQCFFQVLGSFLSLLMFFKTVIIIIVIFTFIAC